MGPECAQYSKTGSWIRKGAGSQHLVSPQTLCIAVAARGNALLCVVDRNRERGEWSECNVRRYDQTQDIGGGTCRCLYLELDSGNIFESSLNCVVRSCHGWCVPFDTTCDTAKIRCQVAPFILVGYFHRCGKTSRWGVVALMMPSKLPGAWCPDEKFPGCSSGTAKRRGVKYREHILRR